MKTATIIDLIVDANIHTQSMNHIIKQQHISQRMRRRLKNNGIITINGQSATWDTLVHGGDHLLMKLAPEQEFSHTPMNLEIVYEDEHILAVNKAAGVLMHPTSTMRDGTLANGVLYYYDETEQAHDFHPVHRLDKDTSGIVIIAKTSIVQHAFVQMDKNLSTQQVLTHVQCVLHTGRTHQIRVHLSHLGFPLAGDDLYGGHLDHIHRQALHAGYLAFTHPMTQEYIELRAPMPTDMKDLLYL